MSFLSNLMKDVNQARQSNLHKAITKAADRTVAVTGKVTHTVTVQTIATAMDVTSPMHQPAVSAYNWLHSKIDELGSDETVVATK